MTILVFLYKADYTSRRMLEGFRLEADRAGWAVQVVEYTPTSGGGYSFLRAHGGSDIPSLLDFWQPDGCIVECDGSVEVVPLDAFPGVPAVFVDRSPADAGPEGVCLVCDNAAVAASAARELLLADFPDYAFVSCPHNRPWSVERGEAFRRIVEQGGRRFHLFHFSSRTDRIDEMLGEIAPWMRALPRPCGVFTSDDRVGEAVAVACENLGLYVPDEVAIVGVDNSESICENTRPTLSSVEKDLYGAGRAAARTLADLMAKRPVPALPLKFGVSRLVRRASTLLVRNGDRRVRRALEFIRRHACEGATAADAMREMGLRHAMADRVFRRATGHTIQDEILDTRVGKVRELLLRHVPVALLADRCGFGSVANLRRAFRNRVGVPVGAWAARHAR